MLEATDILVPVDFSPTSINAVRVAVGLASPGGDLTLLHVIDKDFVEDAVAAGWAVPTRSSRVCARRPRRISRTPSKRSRRARPTSSAWSSSALTRRDSQIARDPRPAEIVMGTAGRSTQARRTPLRLDRREVLRGTPSPCSACLSKVGPEARLRKQTAGMKKLWFGLIVRRTEIRQGGQRGEQ